MDKLLEDLEAVALLPGFADGDITACIAALKCFRTHHAEIAEAVRDARRYRWLRSNSYIELLCDSPRVDGWHPEQLDAAIDAQHNSAREGE